MILVTIESLRADTVPSADPSRPVSPFLDSLADEAAIYTDAHAVTSWTLASHASIFTGLYPTSHQTTGPTSRLGDAYTTVAEALGETGYQCAGIVSGAYLRSEYNLTQGFEFYDDDLATDLMVRSDESPLMPKAHTDVTNPGMLERIEAFLSEDRDPRRPLFLFTYFWDPHYDYLPPPPYDSLFVGPGCVPIDVTRYESRNVVHSGISEGELAYVRAQYLGEIRWTDLHLERMVKLLRDHDLWDDALVILTADHGEEFFDHGNKGHKNGLYVESVKVPLLVKFPEGLGEDPPNTRGTQSSLVSHVDVFPTIAELAGISLPYTLPGRSLLDTPRTSSEAIFYELASIYYTGRGSDPSALEKKEEHWYGIREGSHKLIMVPAQKRIELYDVSEDPRETTNRLEQDEGTARTLVKKMVEQFKLLAAVAQTYQSGGEANLDPAAREQLRSLGYIR